jgi:SRSO17 transposase
MECAFEERKRELEAECKVPEQLFASVGTHLKSFMKPFLREFRRRDQGDYCVSVVEGLCSDLENKNCESIAYFFGLDRKSIQHFVGESEWDDEPLRMELGRQVGADLGEADGVIAFDPSAFPKSGKHSVGVSRQWCGRLGKVDNCQVAVYLGYVSSKGHALVDTQLYLPKEWTQDKARMKRAGVPKNRQRYLSRHEISLELLDRHGASLPHSWITGDDELGRPADFRRKLRDRNERYLLAVPRNTAIRDLEIVAPESSDRRRSGKPPVCRVDRWTSERSEDDWTEIEVRDGEKGPLKVEALKRRVETGRTTLSTVANEILVVIRYRDRDSAIVKTDYYLSNAAPETTLAEFCRAAKAEHRIEECLQRGKGEAGMADYEVRNWRGWHHHQTLSLLASWFLNVETRRTEKKDARDNVQPSATRHRINPANQVGMRYTPHRSMAHRAAIAP